MTLKKLRILRSNKALENENLLEILPFKMPEMYRNIIKNNDGFRLNYEFPYTDPSDNELSYGGIGIIYGLNKGVLENDIINLYNDPAEFFPENLVAFGRDGGGNLICFDYREDPNTDNPPIVYWLHGWGEGKDIAYVAKDFEEFLNILEEPED